MKYKDYNIPSTMPTSNKPYEKAKECLKSRVMLEGDVESLEKKMKFSNIIFYVINAILIGIAIYSFTLIMQYIDERYTSQIAFDSITNEYVQQPVVEAENTTEVDTSAWPPVIDFERLQADNPDVIGWIRIPGTDVDYPILFSPEKDYYLYKDINGNYSGSGSIFADYENSRDLNADDHVVIYGHHMNFAGMFHAVSLYDEPEFFETHRVIYLETPQTSYVLRAVGSYVARGIEYEARQTLFETHNDFQRYLDQRIDRCDQIKYDDYNRRTLDKLITLVTCTNSGDNRQIVECVVEQAYPTAMIPTIIDRAVADSSQN